MREKIKLWICLVSGTTAGFGTAVVVLNDSRVKITLASVSGFTILGLLGGAWLYALLEDNQG